MKEAAAKVKMMTCEEADRSGLFIRGLMQIRKAKRTFPVQGVVLHREQIKKYL